MTCAFCAISAGEILLAGERCLFMDTGDPVLVGSGMIVPRAQTRPELWERIAAISL